MRATQPETFASIIALHNKLIQDTQWIVKLRNISYFQLSHIYEDLLKHENIYDLVSTRRTTSDGEWSMMVPKTRHKTIRNELSNGLLRQLLSAHFPNESSSNAQADDATLQSDDSFSLMIQSSVATFSNMTGGLPADEFLSLNLDDPRPLQEIVITHKQQHGMYLLTLPRLVIQRLRLPNLI